METYNYVNEKLYLRQVINGLRPMHVSEAEFRVPEGMEDCYAITHKQYRVTLRKGKTDLIETTASECFINPQGVYPTSFAEAYSRLNQVSMTLGVSSADSDKRYVSNTHITIRHKIGDGVSTMDRFTLYRVRN
jgi:hypothetical protein